MSGVRLDGSGALYDSTTHHSKRTESWNNKARILIAVSVRCLSMLTDVVPFVNTHIQLLYGNCAKHSRKGKNWNQRLILGANECWTVLERKLS